MGNGHSSLPTTSVFRDGPWSSSRHLSAAAALKICWLRRAATGSDESTSACPSGPKIATTSSSLPPFTACISAFAPSSADANTRCWGPVAVLQAASAPTSAHGSKRFLMTPFFASAGSRRLPTGQLHRRRLPPPPRELLRLRCPRELAARSDFPLEYPENASDLVPL